MRIGTMIRFTPKADSPERLLDRVADYARRIETAGFPSIWVGDSLGRGRPTLDPLVELAVLAAVTRDVELGIGVLQLPLRHPIELAHRVQSVQALSANRLVLGVGSGSTKDDFDLLGYDYDARFRTLRSSLATMRRVWRGEPAETGGTLSTWPTCEGGPPILIGAWRSHRWITLSAKEYQGWTPSGRYSSWADLEEGMRVFREAGGTNAVLANVAVDLANRPGSAELAKVAEPSLLGTPDEVRQKLKRMQQIGFNEVLLVSHHDALEDIERARDLL
ncbi:MAG TPA: LLM class flavin-dependent oxidoreductase [Acetobacteraceae bacterium]|jgi:alkanesulfonate monooxygenase SsuD/methylene tetrahydromethanopterin reductase-like flavin-dependent oxidoreductase (luciferase family)|nr:LLM class flavin-dependent oxidoreductase [Acetobacteraceae bacterium]